MPTGDWVPWKTMSLKASGTPSRWHSVWWPRQTARNGWPAASSSSTAARNRSILGWSPSRGSPGPGPTMTRSCAVERAGGVVLVADHRRWSSRARRARGAACSRSRPRRRGSPRTCPRSARSGAAPPWSVSQNLLSRRLRAFSASSTSSSLTSSAMLMSGVGAAGTRPKALRMPPALACVSATSYAASESRTRVAPAVTLSRPSRSTSAVRMTIGLSTTGPPSASRPRTASAAP